MAQSYVVQLMPPHFKKIQGQQDDAMCFNVVETMSKNNNKSKV